MRKLTMIVCAAGLTAGLGACAHNKGGKGDNVSPDQQAAQAQQQASSNAQAALQNFQKNQQQYIQKSEQDLNQLDARIAAFRAQVPADESQRASHDAAVNTLEDNMHQSREKLNDLKTASLNDWDQKQRDFEQSLLTTRAAYDASAARMAH